MHYTERYPDNFKKILNNVKEYCDKVLDDRNKKVKRERKDGKFYNRPWWDFIENIEIEIPQFPGSSCGLPSDLKKLTSVTCQGDLHKAVFLIRWLAKVAKCIDEEITKNASSVKNLDMICDFISDIERKLRHLNDRSYRNLDLQSSQVDIQYLNPNRYTFSDQGELNWQFRGISRVKRVTLNVQNRGPGKPNPILAGICYVCHRYCSKTEFYCKNHRKSFGGDSNYKSAQRMITGAFNNLIEELDLDIDLVGLNKQERNFKINKYMMDFHENPRLAFHRKACQVIGWSYHQPQHVALNSDIDKWLNFIDESVLLAWSDPILNIFQEFITITKKHDHTNGIFNSSFYSGTNVKTLRDALIKQILRIENEGEIKENSKTKEKELKFDFNFTPLSAITMICRMGQFNLIKQAAKKKLIYS